MAKNNSGKKSAAPIYGFAAAWTVMALILPMYKIWAILLSLVVSALAAVIIRAAGSAGSKKAEKAAAEAAKKAEEESKKAAEVSYGPDVDPILKEGKRALGEMARLYASIKNPDIKSKINEIMRITDKITQDAVADPSDIPQIKKFMNYYLPTTIKLLNTYDRMSAQGIEGENLGKSMQSITEMLDEAIAAYKKRLDSLFANQAMDIEADIKVMNTMLAREGLSGEKDFDIHEQKGQTT